MPAKEFKAKRTHIPWFLWMLLFLLLAILPSWAILAASRVIDARFVGGYLLVISVITFLMYRSDKQRAQSEEWRIPESKLHLFELAGGWMVAFWTQRILRHKIRKSSYQITFWIIGLLHQYIAFDFLHNWHYSHEIFAFGKRAFAFIQPYLQ
jgi:uncharacterized membrane protein YsdA (DUF1294 family)